MTGHGIWGHIPSICGHMWSYDGICQVGRIPDGMESDMYGTSLQGLNLSFYQDSALTHAVVMHMVSFCDYSSGEREIIMMNE